MVAVPTVLVPIEVGVVELACPITKAVVATCVVLVFWAAVGAAKLPAVDILPPVMLPVVVI